MGVDRAIDITAKQRKTILALLERHLPNTTAWVYGSRAKWASRPQSDLDMVVFSALEQNGRVSDLREAFEESNLPFRVDLFVWDTVPVQFRKQIKRDHVVVCSGGKHGMEDKWAKLTPLRDLCKSVVDCHHSTPVWTDTGVIVLRNQNIRNGRLDLSEPSYTDERHYAERTRRAAPRSDDLVITREAPMGEVCMVPAGLRCCLGQRMVLLRPDPAKTVPRYLLYALQSKTVRHEIGVSEGTGSTVSNLRIPLLEALPIPSRRLPEQRAIAHILGTLDDKIELNRRMNETLEAMARALFKSWFVDFDPVRAKMAGRDTGLPQVLADLFPDRLVNSDLGEIPEGWRIRQLGEMAIVVDCLHSRKPERQKDGPVLIQVFNIGPTGRLDFSNPYNVTEDDYAEWTRRMEVLPGDLVVTKTGRVGAVGQMPKGYKAAMGRNMVGVRAILGRSLPGFLKDSLLSDRMCREMMRNTNDGTILRSLHVKAISQLQEVLPPYDLVSSYEALIAPVHAKLEQNDVESKTLASLRDHAAAEAGVGRSTGDVA